MQHHVIHVMENSHQTGDHFQLWSQSLGSVTDLRIFCSVPCRARALQIRCPPGLHDPTCCGHQRGMLVSSSCRRSSSNADQIWSINIIVIFKTKSVVQSGRIGNNKQNPSTVYMGFHCSVVEDRTTLITSTNSGSAKKDMCFWVVC